MKCEEYQELISARLDGELIDDEEHLLAEHLKTCQVCRKFEKDIAEISEAMASPTNTMPSQLEKEILHSVASRPVPRGSLRGYLRGYYRVPRGLAWATAAVTLFLVVFSILNPLRGVIAPGSQPSSAPETSSVQKIVLTDNDIVRSYSINEKGSGN